MIFRLSITLLFIFTSLTYSQSLPGSYDTTYGTNGIVGYTFTINNIFHGVSVADIQVLPGNKLLAVGVTKNGCSSTWNHSGIIMRLNHDGSLDTTFNDVGYSMFYDYYSNNYFFESIIAFDSNTFFIMSRNYLLKIDADGNPDTSFGDDGYLSLDIEAYTGVITQDGKIMLGGRKQNSSAQWEVATIRINIDGTTDNSFGVDGLFTIPHQVGASTAFRDIYVDQQNRILLACRRQVSQNNGKIIAFRLLEDGSYDTSFSDNGTYFENVHYEAQSRSIMTTPEGKILISGNGKIGSWDNYGLILIQLNEDGTLDTDFAVNGRVQLPIYSESTAVSLHILEDESIVVTGGYQSTYIAKFNKFGNLVSDFGENGVVNEFLFDWTGYNTPSKVTGNRIILSANTAFAHCAQQKHEALFMRFFLDDKGLEITAFPAENISECDASGNGSETATFDITINDEYIIAGQSGASVTYHLSQEDADSGDNTINNADEFVNTSNPQNIFARIQDFDGNFDTTIFTLTVLDQPTVYEPEPLTLCDINGNGYTSFVLSDKNNEITGGVSNVNVTYYLSFSDAQDEHQPLDDLYFENTLPYNQTIYARVWNQATSCFNIIALELNIVQLYIDSEPENIFIDEGDGNGTATFNLTINESLMLGNQNSDSIHFQYFESFIDAQNNIDSISNTSQYINVENPQTIFVRMIHTQTDDCFELTSFEIETDSFLNVSRPEYSSIMLYPNPANEVLYLNSNVEIGEVSIFNMLGQKLKMSSHSNNTQIDISHLSPGNYLLSVYIQGEVKTFKIIKQ